MSLHLTPQEGCFQALREEGCIFTRAPSSSAAAFNTLALPTVASLCASPSEPSRQPSPQLSPHVLAALFRGIPSGHLGTAVIHDTCITRFFSTKKSACSVSVPGSACGTCQRPSRAPVQRVAASYEQASALCATFLSVTEAEAWVFLPAAVGRIRKTAT